MALRKGESKWRIAGLDRNGVGILDEYSARRLIDALLDAYPQLCEAKADPDLEQRIKILEERISQLEERLEEES